MTIPTDDQHDVERTETQDLTVHIFRRFLRMVFWVAGICVVVVVIALVAALVFVGDTYMMDTCPDYPKCSSE